MGFLCGKCYAEEGANVVLTDINKEALDQKFAEINEMGKGKAIGVVVDVRDYNMVKAAADKAVSITGTTYFIDGGRAASGHEGYLLKKEV